MSTRVTPGQAITTTRAHVRRAAAAAGAWSSRSARRALHGAARRLAADRGDVPGWVLITLMTAAIVVALWAVAADQLVAIFNNAMKPFLGGNVG
ncbi:hypothetical protein BF93_01740 [Brachybacterium phenoliresistens]|uniref:Uncharacterized protein n=1 Tax=Brachybacterium phenoliresistens TaxID=396014 RepID=Z9JR07_9MICO|nr:hypothetical protein [Brachybacterium phenoliresistens]EWS80825.1 hypothetical protein BF93_01740 [Brachybacterium phenoliresistens]